MVGQSRRSGRARSHLDGSGPAGGRGTGPNMRLPVVSPSRHRPRLSHGRCRTVAGGSSGSANSRGEGQAAVRDVPRGPQLVPGARNSCRGTELVPGRPATCAASPQLVPRGPQLVPGHGHPCPRPATRAARPATRARGTEPAPRGPPGHGHVRSFVPYAAVVGLGPGHRPWFPGFGRRRRRSGASSGQIRAQLRSAPPPLPARGPFGPAGTQPKAHQPRTRQESRRSGASVPRVALEPACGGAPEPACG